MAIIPTVHQLKITLNYISPPIWRSFQVRSDVKLTKLHEIIQIVMGWENCHLYTFHVGGIAYTDPASVEDDIYGMGYRNAAINPCFTTYSMLPLWRGLFWEHCLTPRFPVQDAEGTDGIKHVRYQT